MAAMLPPPGWPWSTGGITGPGFNAKLAEPIICGFIYDAACGHCGAKLFKGETVPVQEARRPSCVARTAAERWRCHVALQEVHACRGAPAAAERALERQDR